MKINKISFSVDKKLSINYNSVGMSIGVEADVGEDEGLAVATQLRELAEGLIDGMIVESIQALPALTAKAKK
jgi:hypothetical protein